jgi:hypothetical protein
VPPAGGTSSIQPDAREASDLLRAYVCTDSEPVAAATLNRLFEEHISQWCGDAARRTLRNYGLRGADQTDEESEVAAEVLLQMAGRLREIRHSGAPPIANLRAYAVSAVYNSCFARIRARCPRHVQLQNRIRYLLRNDKEFAAWTSNDGEQLAGLRRWDGRNDFVSAPVPQRTGDSLKLLLQAIFEMAQAPVRVSDLTGAAADSLGITDSPVSSLSEQDEYPADHPAADRVMIERESLTGLWKEVLELPRTQRCALLLNLRDAGGHGVIELIPATGTATFEQLAEALDLSAGALAEIWPELPMEDARIAGMLGLTRQQVINLRKAARDRLARRQRKADGNTRVAPASDKLPARGVPGIVALVGERIKSILDRGQGAE